MSIPVRVRAGAAPVLVARLAALLALAAALAGASGTGEVRRVPRAASHRAWLRLLAESAGAGAGAGAGAEAEGDADGAGWFPRPIPVSLPMGRGADGRPATLPLLIVPVPVPAPAPDVAPATECRAGRSQPAPAPGPWRPAPVLRDALASSPVTPRDGLAPVAPVAPVASIAPPSLDYVVSSQQLVELFKAQQTAAAELPPALLPADPADPVDPAAAPAAGPPRRARHVRMRRYQPPAGAAADTPPPAPPAPRFQRSHVLRGELTVPRAGYTEPFVTWWDAGTGASRVDLHGGATSAYRTVLPDGRLQGTEVRVDRTGEGEVRRCAVAEPRVPDASDAAPPALPDLQNFSFAGYSEAEYGRVELWTRTVSGGSGELGAVRGEVLTFRHEMLLARAPDNYTVTPLRYSVGVDSSVLGPDCDGHVFTYTELRDQQPDPVLLNLDVGETCEQVEQATRRDRVEPLREYTLPQRDPKYDADYKRFKTDYGRQYADDTEEAVRKTAMVHHSRFISSGNRQGATFGMEVNYLGDRLDAELGVLRGVREQPAGPPAERFPHSRDQLDATRERLPRAFDWRERGAVTPVRYQGSCSSCWAFAVTGAVEGALFVRTQRLEALSEQALVDCAREFGAHGCGGTWPSAAYAYVRARGLPALPDYTPYSERELTCRDASVPPVTHISSHVNVTSHSVQALKVAIRRHAPTVVIIDAEPKSFVFYKKGVLQDERCAKDAPRHAVLAVGWGARRGSPHFILKNSWSAGWGEAGYARVAGAGNTCGVLSRPSYPRLARADVTGLAADTAR